MEAKITDEQKRLHNLLLTEINDQVNTSSAEYSGFKLQITNHLGGAGVLGRCNGLFDIFRQLTRRNKLGAAPKRGAEGVDRDPSDGKWKTIDGLEYYETLNKTGFLLVLHFYKNREGLEGDLVKLTDFFKNSLGFDMLVLPYKEIDRDQPQRMLDHTSEQVTAVLEKVRTYLKKNHKEYYCFLCIVLSHGKQDIITTEDSSYNVHDIKKMFINTEFEEFTGKPKIFIIQSCQGKKKQVGVRVDDQSDNGDQQRVVTPVDLADQFVFLPKDAGSLIIFATTPEHEVRADMDQGGSLLIHKLVKVLEEYHEQYHLEDMLITVRDRVIKELICGNYMMPNTRITLTKRLKFEQGTPRIPGDSSQRFVRIDSNGGVHIDAIDKQ